MKLNLEEMREIARTLPIGYYLGRKVPVVIESGGEAYCNVVTNEIHVGIGLLQVAADQIGAADAAKWDREKLLRCLLYHECGHVLLSPPWLKERFNLPMTPEGGKDPDGADLVNTFEDERLEQMLSKFFLGVDFKGFVRLVHKSGVQDTRTGKFFKAVRLRQTTPEISAAVDAAVQKLAWCNSQSQWYEHGSGGMCYREVLQELINMIAPYSKPQQQPQQQQQQQGSDKPQGQQPEQQQSEQDGSEGKSSEGLVPEDGDDAKGAKSKGDGAERSEPEGKSGEGGGGQHPGEVELPDGFLKSLADKVFVTPPSEVEDALKRLAVRLSKRKGAQAAGRWSALHGRIDARRDAQDKERIFRRRSDAGASLMSSVHLTLWVDCSGSFHASETKLNQILAATSRALAMSGGKLVVDVVKMGYHAALAASRDWRIETGGGNDIDYSFVDAWRQTRRKDRRNIDFVVFDGPCCSAVDRVSTYEKTKDRVAELKAKGYKRVCVKCRGGLKKLKAKADAAYGRIDDMAKICCGIWNHPDCYVISDTSNKPLFDRLAKAHVTYMESGYAEQLQAEVMKMLDRIL